VQKLLRQKYGLLKRSLDAFNKLIGMVSRKPGSGSEYIEIVPRPHD
jgi:hypothetical protein